MGPEWRGGAAVLAVLFAASSSATAAVHAGLEQDAASAPTIQVQVVPVDDHGSFVGGLEVQHFSVRVDGEPRPVLAVDRGSPVVTIERGPRRLVAYFDQATGAPRVGQWDHAVRELQRVVERMSAADEMAVVAFRGYRELVVYTGFTNDRAELSAALERAPWPDERFLQSRQSERHPAGPRSVTGVRGVVALERLFAEGASGAGSSAPLVEDGLRDFLGQRRITHVIFMTRAQGDVLFFVSRSRDRMRRSLQTLREHGIVLHGFQPFEFTEASSGGSFLSYLGGQTLGTWWGQRTQTAGGLDTVLERAQQYYALTIESPEHEREIEIDIEVTATGVADWLAPRRVTLWERRRP